MDFIAASAATTGTPPPKLATRAGLKPAFPSAKLGVLKLDDGVITTK